MKRYKILTIVSHFLPGFKAGGPIQSIKNLINLTNNELDYLLFTSNHEFNEKTPFANIQTDQWNDKYGAKIFYTSDKNKIVNLKNILKSETFSMVFLNSFFSKDTILTLFLYKLLKLNQPIIMMPRGELSVGALKNKKIFKKTFYISLTKLLGFYKNVTFFSTAKDETAQIKKIMGNVDVYEVGNVPNTEKKLQLDTKNENELKVVFLSRITPKKNLLYSLETLMHCENVIFDIYGILEDERYWQECQNLIKQLPKSIEVNYKGELSNEKVIETLSHYDLFYFPTKSENYGHVISEALQASLPVLISNTTPWQDLEEKEFGWVLPLNNKLQFSEVIRNLKDISQEEHNLIKSNIYNQYDTKVKAEKISDDFISKVKQLISTERN